MVAPDADAAGGRASSRCPGVAGGAESRGGGGDETGSSQPVINVSSPSVMGVRVERNGIKRVLRAIPTGLGVRVVVHREQRIVAGAAAAASSAPEAVHAAFEREAGVAVGFAS